MRLAYVRAAVLSLIAGGSLTLGVLAGWPGAARAGTVKAGAASPSPSTSTSASAATATKCEVLPAASTATPTPTPSVPPDENTVAVAVTFLLVHLRLADRPGVG